MVIKLTIVGRANDGFPVAQSPRYHSNEEEEKEKNPNYKSIYKQQAEFLLQEISNGAIQSSDQFVIHVDHNSFNCLIDNGVCFIALCDSSYPRKLVFHYLQDLQQEFHKFDMPYIHKIIKPYSFVKFDGIIGRISKQYVDTRTQANLSKLNAANSRRQNPDIATNHFSQLVERRRRLEMLERLVEEHQNVSSIWGSKNLEVIALKWTPITIIIVVTSVLLWAMLVLKDDFV